MRWNTSPPWALGVFSLEMKIIRFVLLISQGDRQDHTFGELYKLQGRACIWVVNIRGLQLWKCKDLVCECEWQRSLGKRPLLVKADCYCLLIWGKEGNKITSWYFKQEKPDYWSFVIFMLLRLTELDQRRRLKWMKRYIVIFHVFMSWWVQKLMPSAAGPLQSRNEHITVCSFIIYLRSISLS